MRQCFEGNNNDEEVGEGTKENVEDGLGRSGRSATMDLKKRNRAKEGMRRMGSLPLKANRLAMLLLLA